MNPYSFIDVTLIGPEIVDADRAESERDAGLCRGLNCLPARPMTLGSIPVSGADQLEGGGPFPLPGGIWRTRDGFQHLCFGSSTRLTDWWKPPTIGRRACTRA